jgi:hypothetical protein
LKKKGKRNQKLGKSTENVDDESEDEKFDSDNID